MRFGQQLALRSRALGCPALYGAAGAEPGCASGRQPGVLCVLSGSFFMQCGGLLSLAPTLFTGTAGSSEGEQSTAHKMRA